MSIEQKMGPCRCRETVKPRLQRQPISFFRCGKCNTIFRAWTQGQKKELSCCGELTQQLSPKSADELPDGAQLRYDIVGGFNENCIRVFWSGTVPSWLYLETYTGGQQLELSSKKRPPAVFALAGEDAYAYCEEDPCLKCTFRCKNGFVLYAYYEELGLFALPINQIDASPASGGYTTRMQQRNQ